MRDFIIEFMDALGDAAKSLVITLISSLIVLLCVATFPIWAIPYAIWKSRES